MEPAGSIITEYVPMRYVLSLVLPPVIVQADCGLQILQGWVSGDASGSGNGIRPAFVSLGLSGGALTLPFDHRMCAAKGQIGYYSQSLTGTP